MLAKAEAGADRILCRQKLELMKKRHKSRESMKLKRSFKVVNFVLYEVKLNRISDDVQLAAC